MVEHCDSICVLLATGPGNPPADRVPTAKTVQFGSKPVQKPDMLHLRRQNPDPYLSTHRVRGVSLDLLVPISGSGFRVFLFIVALSHPIPNWKILTSVYRCPFQMYCPPLSSKTSEKHSWRNPETESQRRVNEYWSCILGNLSGNWMQTFINEI
jgi:hypothetical protein